MQHLLKHLPAFLSLLIPLLALAWLGSREMGRLEDQAEQALQDHAASFLRETSARLEAELSDATAALLARDMDLGRHSLVQVAETLIEEDPVILDLIILEADGSLRHPTLPPGIEASLPFHKESGVRAIDDAEALETWGDHEGARALLESHLASVEPSSRNWRQMMRAHFNLAGLYRREELLDLAEEQYWNAYEFTFSRRSRSLDSEAAGIHLLCNVALAEVEAERDANYTAMVDLMRDIADGIYDPVGEDLLKATFDRLRAQIPLDSDRQIDAEEITVTQRIREEGRSFAQEYNAFLIDTSRRRMAQTVPGGVAHVLHATPQGQSLLAFRKARQSELQADWIGPFEWIGLRLNLDLLLADALGEAFAAEQADFRLAISSTDGDIVFATSDLEAPLPDLVEESRVSFAGLQLTATPIQPEAYLDARRATIRNRALLFLALSLVAGGGAFFLVRSVARETQLANLKVQLVSRVSHELKTPLALIKMYSETIGMGRSKDEKQTRKFSHIIAREADSLSMMIERVLDFSRREQGQIEYARVPTDLREVLNSVSDAYRPHLEDRGFSLESSLQAGVVSSVDRTALESALVNLLENAIKYSQPTADGSHIGLRLSKSGEKAVIEVLDRGIGIPEKERAQVFSSFYRASNAGEARGAGLGLSLVKHFVDAHEGEIEAIPRESGGSMIRMTLPSSQGTAPDSKDDSAQIDAHQAASSVEQRRAPEKSEREITTMGEDSNAS
ncbi:MAG: sensor histidine kinase [Planctomycetota bacterium]|jgi:signal transduction histidine kinase